MSKSLFKWVFEKQEDLYKIKQLKNSISTNKPLYLSSYYSSLKPNKKVNCPTPVMMTKPGDTITPNYYWSVEKTRNINTYYIKQSIDNNILYLAICKHTDTVYLTTIKYMWNIINMTDLRNNEINDKDEYIIIDGSSTKTLSMTSSNVILSITFLWRLTQNPFQNIIDTQDYSIDLAKYNSFFINGNIGKNTSGSIYLRFNKYDKSGIEHIELDAIDATDTSATHHIQSNIKSFKWNVSTNKLVNISKGTPHLTYDKKKNRFGGTMSNNMEWDIINLTRSIGFRNNDIIVINTKSNDMKKTLIYDNSQFKYIKTDILNHINTNNIINSCMETKTLDLYIGKYNYAIDNIKRINSNIKTTTTKLKGYNLDSVKKTNEINNLHSTMGDAIVDADNKHFGDSDDLRNKLESNNNDLQSDHTNIKTTIHSTNKTLNLMSFELNNHIKERDKWEQLILTYETECNKENAKKKDEELSIHNYIKNIQPDGIPELFEPVISNIKNSTIDADSQITIQKNIINEKNSILPIRISMLGSITESNNVKRNIIYLTSSFIIVLIVIIIITYVRNNKIYIDNPFV